MPEPVTMIAVGSGVVGLATHLSRRYFEIAKEVVDIILGCIAFVLALPIFVICAIIIRLSSKGPVLFLQTRAGKDGKPFKMYKFRTMHIDAEANSGAVWAEDNDPRIISACRWMRISHMDEWPQLINVIRGDMSLVGPRPERPEILEDLEKVYPDVRKRLSVKPGITGLAQIRSGYDTSVEQFRQKLKSDLEYINNRKWAMELSILAKTVGKIRDKGAR